MLKSVKAALARTRFGFSTKERQLLGLLNDAKVEKFLKETNPTNLKVAVEDLIVEAYLNIPQFKKLVDEDRASGSKKAARTVSLFLDFIKDHNESNAVDWVKEDIGSQKRQAIQIIEESIPKVKKPKEPRPEDTPAKELTPRELSFFELDKYDVDEDIDMKKLKEAIAFFGSKRDRADLTGKRLVLYNKVKDFDRNRKEEMLFNLLKTIRDKIIHSRGKLSPEEAKVLGHSEENLKNIKIKDYLEDVLDMFELGGTKINADIDLKTLMKGIWFFTNNKKIFEVDKALQTAIKKKKKERNSLEEARFTRWDNNKDIKDEKKKDILFRLLKNLRDDIIDKRGKISKDEFVYFGRNDKDLKDIVVKNFVEGTKSPAPSPGQLEMTDVNRNLLLPFFGLVRDLKKITLGKRPKKEKEDLEKYNKIKPNVQDSRVGNRFSGFQRAVKNVLPSISDVSDHLEDIQEAANKAGLTKDELGSVLYADPGNLSYAPLVPPKEELLSELKKLEETQKGKEGPIFKEKEAVDWEREKEEKEKAKTKDTQVKREKLSPEEYNDKLKKINAQIKLAEKIEILRKPVDAYLDMLIDKRDAAKELFSKVPDLGDFADLVKRSKETFRKLSEQDEIKKRWKTNVERYYGRKKEETTKTASTSAVKSYASTLEKFENTKEEKNLKDLVEFFEEGKTLDMIRDKMLSVIEALPDAEFNDTGKSFDGNPLAGEGESLDKYLEEFVNVKSIFDTFDPEKKLKKAMDIIKNLSNLPKLIKPVKGGEVKKKASIADSIYAILEKMGISKTAVQKRRIKYKDVKTEHPITDPHPGPIPSEKRRMEEMDKDKDKKKTYEGKGRGSGRRITPDSQAGVLIHNKKLTKQGRKALTGFFDGDKMAERFVERMAKKGLNRMLLVGKDEDPLSPGNVDKVIDEILKELVGVGKDGKLDFGDILGSTLKRMDESVTKKEKAEGEKKSIAETKKNVEKQRDSLQENITKIMELQRFLEDPIENMKGKLITERTPDKDPGQKAKEDISNTMEVIRPESINKGNYYGLLMALAKNYGLSVKDISAKPPEKYEGPDRLDDSEKTKEERDKDRSKAQEKSREEAHAEILKHMKKMAAKAVKDVDTKAYYPGKFKSPSDLREELKRANKKLKVIYTRLRSIQDPLKRDDKTVNFLEEGIDLYKELTDVDAIRSIRTKVETDLKSLQNILSFVEKSKDVRKEFRSNLTEFSKKVIDKIKDELNVLEDVDEKASKDRLRKSLFERKLDEFKKARDKNERIRLVELANLEELNPSKEVRKEMVERKKERETFREIGKDPGQWRITLEKLMGQYYHKRKNVEEHKLEGETKELPKPESITVRLKKIREVESELQRKMLNLVTLADYTEAKKKYDEVFKTRSRFNEGIEEANASIKESEKELEKIKAKTPKSEKKKSENEGTIIELGKAIKSYNDLIQESLKSIKGTDKKYKEYKEELEKAEAKLKGLPQKHLLPEEKTLQSRLDRLLVEADGISTDPHVPGPEKEAKKEKVQKEIASIRTKLLNIKIKNLSIKLKQISSDKRTDPLERQKNKVKIQKQIVGYKKKLDDMRKGVKVAGTGEKDVGDSQFDIALDKKESKPLWKAQAPKGTLELEDLLKESKKKLVAYKKLLDKPMSELSREEEFLMDPEKGPAAVMFILDEEEPRLKKIVDDVDRFLNKKFTVGKGGGREKIPFKESYNRYNELLEDFFEGIAKLDAQEEALTKRQTGQQAIVREEEQQFDQKGEYKGMTPQEETNLKRIIFRQMYKKLDAHWSKTIGKNLPELGERDTEWYNNVYTTFKSVSDVISNRKLVNMLTEYKKETRKDFGDTRKVTRLEDLQEQIDYLDEILDTLPEEKIFLKDPITGYGKKSRAEFKKKLQDQHDVLVAQRDSLEKQEEQIDRIFKEMAQVNEAELKSATEKALAERAGETAEESEKTSKYKGKKIEEITAELEAELSEIVKHVSSNSTAIFNL